MTAEATTPRTLESRKLQLIERLAATKNEAIIQQLEVLLLEEADWWDELTEKEKADLQEGLADLENGRTETYEAFTARMNQKFK
jgi:hypothetical protein